MHCTKDTWPSTSLETRPFASNISTLLYTSHLSKAYRMHRFLYQTHHSLLALGIALQSHDPVPVSSAIATPADNNKNSKTHKNAQDTMWHRPQEEYLLTVPEQEQGGRVSIASTSAGNMDAGKLNVLLLCKTLRRTTEVREYQFGITMMESRKVCKHGILKQCGPAEHCSQKPGWILWTGFKLCYWVLLLWIYGSQICEEQPRLQEGGNLQAGGSEYKLGFNDS